MASSTYQTDLEPIFQRLDVTARAGDVYSILRQFPIDIVARILSDIPTEYGAARSDLPSMVEPDAQLQWTGASGEAQLYQTCSFVRAMEIAYLRHTGQGLEGRTILDYGCGCGRIFRLMYKFTPPENIYACDPWDSALGLCRRHRMRGNFALCQDVPTCPPFEGVTFDLIYAFSVFTHLSEKTAKAVMSVCGQMIGPNGLMVITIRPRGYWTVHQQSQNALDPAQLLRAHDSKGFAFEPHAYLTPIDGDTTYGDTSMSLDYIEDAWTDWRIAGVDSMVHDQYQTIVALSPAD